MKRILFKCILIVTLFLSSISLVNVVYADEELFTNNGFQYYIQDNAIVIVNYYGNESELTIPWAIGDYEVKIIEEGAFKNSNVTSLKIPENVSYIDLSVDAIKDIKYYDASGNEVEKKIELPIIEKEDSEVKEDYSSESSEDSIFEDKSIDISDDFFASTEIDNSDNQEVVDDTSDEDSNPINRIINRVRSSFLYNGGQFASNFASNPIGYLFIGISIIVLIVAIVVFIQKRK